MALRRGCCCCELRTASRMIGIVLLVITCIGLISIIVKWVSFSTDKQSLYNTPDLPAEVAEFLATWERFYIALTVFTTLTLLFNALLVLGTWRTSVCAVLAWLIYHGIVFFIFTLMSIGLLIASGVVHAASAQIQQAVRDAPQPGTADLIGFTGFAFAVTFGVTGACCLLISPLLWYWYAVVVAFHRELGGYGVRGAAQRGQAGQGGEEGNVAMVALPGK